MDARSTSLVLLVAEEADPSVEALLPAMPNVTTQAYASAPGLTKARMSKREREIPSFLYSLLCPTHIPTKRHENAEKL